ncbi:MAG: TldD/PmbA family protein [Desulfurococcales archaeon]|nr:TldD/PmbA family protein [Desulfurococcales archaeon]
MSVVDDLVSAIESIVKGRVDEYSVKVVRSRSVMVKLAKGEISVTQSWDDLGVGLYIARDGKIAVLEYETSDPREAISRSVELIDKLEKSPLYAPLPDASGEELSFVDPRVKEIAESGDASGLISDLGLEELGEVAGMIEASYWEKRLVTSKGADFGEEGTSFEGYLRAFRGEASGQWSWVSTSYDVGLASRAVEKAVELAEECSKLPAENPEPGRYRVLLSPMIAGNLIETAARSLSAGAVFFGFSYFADKKPGERVASEVFSLRETPRDSSLPFFAGFDDEGVATRDKELISRGILKTFLHNTKTAKLMGAQTTGNAGWVLPRLFNLHVEPGDLSDGELFDALGNGLYFTNNWYTRFQNYPQGQFSTVTRDAAFIVKNGKPVACTKRLRISDTMPSLLSSIEALGKGLWQIKWWEVDVPTRLPHIIVSDLGISRPSLEGGPRL